MAYEKIVAFYDKAGKARDAARALESSGFTSGDINVLNRDSVSDKDFRDGNLWQRLLGRPLSDSESAVYRRTVDSGGAVLTLRTPDSDVTRAMNILHVHGPMDLNDRSTASATAAVSPASTLRADTKDEVLRLVEEQLSVGKRQVATGKSRIRRFVVEKPVETQITLHEEHCEVARRPVTDATLPRDADWRDQTIEVIETSEEAVVTKTPRITEEVVIRRRGSDHVETIRDTVRRQQIEVDRVQSDAIPRDVKKAA